MARSLGLALYLMTAARGGAGPGPARPARPPGRMVWLHAGAGASVASLGQLARRLLNEADDLNFLLTSEAATPAAHETFPPGSAVDTLPADKTQAVASFLDHWRPDLAVLAGASLMPAMIVECGERGIPLVLADLKLDAAGGKGWGWRRGVAASLLGRFRHVLVQDPATRQQIEEIGGRELAIELTGRIEDTSEPLPGNEAERTEIAEILRTRPVWLAVNCPEAEEEAVLAAHAQAMRFAHRMLLIVVPAQPARAAGIAERAGREGWLVAKRSADEDPEPEVQVFIADDEELGLWYRLAPVTYMGGTLLPGGSGRNPFEPAALGSAILHGPHPGPYPDAYARLAAAGATQAVDTPAALIEAVSELIAPDRAAALAHNAWAASSGGAEVADRVAAILLTALGTPGGKAP